MYKRLSDQFNFKVAFKEAGKTCQQSVVTVWIYEKRITKPVQKIRISGYFMDDAYEDGSNVRSYTTSFNRNKAVCDNIYGHLVVADFNFDSREDIALVSDSGGNGGPIYDYYLQDDSCHFVFSKYLSSRMKYFPTTFNEKKKTLTTYVHAGACCMGKDVYRLDTINGNWKYISHKLIEY
jgi:hypothetical protein